ncbi:hypothetical protein GCM10023170_061300 [Phytohabitans houttuyneae]|uniref:hypothetical protein n=1 Tax=Phytohabitans houttuyneae TaxID=1076126 RepID=UPI0031E91095
MPDAVWRTSHPRPTSSRNGFGRELKGFTRPDESGHRFATCWVVAFGMPIVPVSRCYLREDRAFTTAARGFRLHSAARYQIDGQSRRRWTEIVRTYAFCWLLVPAIVIAPTLVLLSQADRIVDTGADGATGPKLALVAVFLLLLTGSILALSAALALYRTRWAPVRAAKWVDPPPDAR